MTWKEFKERLEELGVKNDDRISWIDVNGWDSEFIKVCRDKDNTIEVMS